MRNHLLPKTEHGRIALRQGRVMVRRSVVLALLLVVSGAVPVLAAEKFQHEGWSGRAVFQDGKFRQCHMWMAAINNWDLGLAIDSAGELKLGVRSRRSISSGRCFSTRKLPCVFKSTKARC